MIRQNHFFASALGHLLTIVPAMICGCSGDMLHEAPLHRINFIRFSSEHKWSAEGSTLDIFAFENSRLKELDSYQRIEDFTEGYAHIASTGGEKLFFLCADGQRTRYEWADISAYSSLHSISCNLENESLHRRTMTGECITNAGNVITRVKLWPLTVEIVLKAICSDFSGTPYAEAAIRDVKVYLTNVNASCQLLYNEGDPATRIINTGMLNESDLCTFRSKEIIMLNLAEEVDRRTLYPDAHFLCYPNTPSEDSPGSPFTRLVIEGTIDSHTYYWPITINPPEGVKRGCRYIYDIFIRRKGVTDPDTPVDPTSIEFKMSIKPWNEKEEYSVGF